MFTDVKAVIFDLDGLMFDTESVGHIALKRALAEMGYSLPVEVFNLSIGRTANNTRNQLRTEFGEQFDADRAVALQAVYMDEELETNGLAHKPGLHELLDFLDARHLSKAVASSSPRPYVILRLLHAAIDKRFDAIVCGDEIEHGKPAPDIFLKAASLLDVNPAHCLVLEDSDAGVRAAHAAAMRVIMVPDILSPSEEIQPLATTVCSSLHDVPGLLANA